MPIKSQQQILDKLGIEQLNPMQLESGSVINNRDEVMILSPTGTGKTLAFLLPLIELLDSQCSEVQILIVVPTRELAIQIEQVVREMGTGYKANAIYGGRAGAKDKVDLDHRPAILIGTPGRVADHLRRKTFSTQNIQTLVLDEFDKSLEIGFEEEMREVMSALPGVKKKILTSATRGVTIPKFVSFQDYKTVDYLDKEVAGLEVKVLRYDGVDRHEALAKALQGIGNFQGIVFCNFKDTIGEVSDFLNENGIEHGCFYGGMEQKDRERALIKFRNGTYRLLIATDLAARGIDVPEIQFIIHYQLPLKEKEFIHRNGRTARMNKEGIAYILETEDSLPEFVKNYKVEQLANENKLEPSLWSTLFISGGRRDKISKGDIVGLFLKQGQLNKDQLGVIELKRDCAFVSVHRSHVQQLISKVNNVRLKKKKIRVTII